MVARVDIGETIRGVLSYNENKVKEGVAQCIDAVGFGCTPEELSFKNKLNRFTNLTERNKITKKNAIHISLSFHPDEQFPDQLLREIASTYMEKIGFGDQPYLVYRHDDTANMHMHIATVNIRSNGKRIDTHFIGENESSIARREIEEEFGLIKAEEQEPKLTAGLKPADLSVAEYGKRPTKNQISNIVRTIAKYYRYASFKEYSDLLMEYNVLAIRGEPGTKMYEAGGLVYQLFDKKKGEGVGVQIKSSSIYEKPTEKPTLKNIEARYERNKQSKLDYRQRLAKTIDRVLQRSVNTTEFIRELQEENIIASFKRNEEGHIYGLTYIDKTTCCFFNGSDIAKGYSAKSILERLQTGTETENAFNRDFVNQLLEQTDFSKDFPLVLTGWISSGALVHAFDSYGGMTCYKIGNRQTKAESFLPVNEKMSRYFRANHLSALHTHTIIDKILPRLFPSASKSTSGQEWQTVTAILQKELGHLLHELFESGYGGYAQPVELLKEARKKKRRRSS